MSMLYPRPIKHVAISKLIRRRTLKFRRSYVFNAFSTSKLPAGPISWIWMQNDIVHWRNVGPWADFFSGESRTLQKIFLKTAQTIIISNEKTKNVQLTICNNVTVLKVVLMSIYISISKQEYNSLKYIMLLYSHFHARHTLMTCFFMKVWVIQNSPTKNGNLNLVYRSKIIF